MAVKQRANRQGRGISEQRDHFARLLRMGKRLGGLFAQPRDYRDSIGSEYQKRIMSVSNYPRQLRFKNTVEEIEHSLFVQLSHLSKCPPESASFSTKLVAAAIRSRRVMSG